MTSPVEPFILTVGGGIFDNFSITVETFQSNLRLIVMKHRLHLSNIIYLPSLLRHLLSKTRVSPLAEEWDGGQKGQEVSREKGGTEGKEQGGMDRKGQLWS